MSFNPGLTSAIKADATKQNEGTMELESYVTYKMQKTHYKGDIK